MSEQVEKLRALRHETGASLKACREALATTHGDLAASLALLERAKVEEVQRRSGCSRRTALAALEHSKGEVERAVELARSPTVPVVPEFERVTARAQAFLTEHYAALGLHELRDALPHAKAGPAASKLARVLEFYSVMASCDAETFLEDEDNDPVGTFEALEEVGATTLARRLKRAVDGPRHLEARALLEREFFAEEEPLLTAVLEYIRRNDGLLDDAAR